MLEISIPGRGTMALEHLVLDVNGTLATDGRLLPGVAERLAHLRSSLQPVLLTADTHGGLAALNASLQLPAHKLTPGREAEQKAAFVRELGAERTVAVGNGANDAGMLRAAALGIAVLGEEGLAVACLQAADLVAPDIAHALDLLLQPKRLVATLRA